MASGVPPLSPTPPRADAAGLEEKLTRLPEVEQQELFFPHKAVGGELLSPVSPAYSTPLSSPAAQPDSSGQATFPAIQRSFSSSSSSSLSSSSSSPSAPATRRPAPKPLELSKTILWSDHIDPRTAVPVPYAMSQQNTSSWVAESRARSPLVSGSNAPLRSPTVPVYTNARAPIAHSNLGNSTGSPLNPTPRAGPSAGPSHIPVPVSSTLRSPNPRSATLPSPCFVHSHLDSSLTNFIAKKDAKAAEAMKRKLSKAASTREDEDSDTASGGPSSDTFDSEDDEEPSLTRQLAETAVSVREMSKQLGRARVVSHIQSVLIITKARDNHLIRLTRELALYLMQTPRNGRERGLVVYVDQQLRKSKRFDADGMAEEFPELFRPIPRRYSRTSSSSSIHSPNGGAGGSGSSNGSGIILDPIKRSMTPLSSLNELKRSSEPDHIRRAEGKAEDEGQLRYWTNEMCAKSPHLFDFVVTLGGDGTVLYASWLFQHVVPPIIPFALGSLGFLTCFDFSKSAHVLNNAIEKGIRVNLRMRFTCTVYRATETEENKKRRAVRSGKTGGIFMNSLTKEGWEAIESGEGERVRPQSKKDKEIKCFSTRPVESFEVLNDLVVDRGPSPYVSLLELFGDEHHMTTVQADGLTVSTPTGSTAYSLSAGGSLVHPEIPALLITPICPHTLSFRPMLLPDSMELRICVPYNSRSTAWASFDGRGRVELRQGDHIKVTASKYPFPTVCADNQSTDWFNSISRTLKWNERQRQKSFVILEEGGGSSHKSKRKPATAEDPKTPRPSQKVPQPVGDKGKRNSMDDKENEDGDASEEDDDDEADEDSDDEAEDDEEDEAYDIDDLSSNPTTTASSPVTQANDPPGPVPALPKPKREASASSTTSILSDTSGGSALSSSPPEYAQPDYQSSVDLQELNDRFRVPVPRPPRLSARHSFDERSSSSPSFNPAHQKTGNSTFREMNSALGELREHEGEEGVRDHIHEEGTQGRRASHKATRAPTSKASQKVGFEGDVSAPSDSIGRAFAVVGVDSDSSLSGSDTGEDD